MLVQGVIDYAIYLLDPERHRNELECRRRAHQGLRRRGHRRPAFQPVLHRRNSAPPACRQKRWRPQREKESTRRRIGASARMAPASSPPWSSMRSAEIDGEILGFAKVTRDITERRKAEEALRESERHFRLLVSGVTDYALYMLDPNGMVASWNAGARASRATRPRKSSDSISPSSISRGPGGRLPARALPQRGKPDVMKRKAGAYARTARSFGRAW